MHQHIEELCERGQSLLMATEYRSAEAVLLEAEAAAMAVEDFDALSRLYMPLQESRRQIRQKAGETGSAVLALHLVASSPGDTFSASALAGEFPQAQVLVAGWGTIEPALALRGQQQQHGLLAETFLAAAYPVSGGGVAVAVVPDARVTLPDASPRTVDELLRLLPPHSLLLPRNELPSAAIPASAETYARACRLWEQLHLPWLAMAEAEAVPANRLMAYRRVMEVDPACELANQNLSTLTRDMARRRLRKHVPIPGESE